MLGRATNTAMTLTLTSGQISRSSVRQITKHSGFMYALKTVGGSGSDLMNFLIGRAAHRYGLSD